MLYWTGWPDNVDAVTCIRKRTRGCLLDWSLELCTYMTLFSYKNMVDVKGSITAKKQQNMKLS